MLYQGKKILITGATSGLGKFMALKYAKHGGTIIGIGRDKMKINSLESELKTINNNNHIIKSIDVSSNLLMSQFAVELGRKNNLPDIVIANAAGNFICPIEKLSFNGWNRIMEIVLNGMYNTYIPIGKQLNLKKKPGVFLNISTTYAETGTVGLIPSAVAKSGCDAMMKSLTTEWSKYDHRFVGIAPGPIAESGGANKLDPLGLFQKFNKIHNPRKRMCHPNEIADLACFLTSSQADYINGCIVRIDGGEVNANSGEFNFLRYIPFSGF